MSDFEIEYSNGADGFCAECGVETDEPWHRLCSDCWAVEQGWRRPPRPALRRQHEDRAELSHLRMLERIAELERRVEQLEHPGGLYDVGGGTAA